MNLNDINLIKHNGSEIELIKWNGIILYTKDINQYYIEYTVDNTSTLSLNSRPSASTSYNGLPYIYSDESTYSIEYDKVEITLLDGTITDDVSTTCNQISKVKLWYPESTMAIKFNLDSSYGTPLVKEVNHIGTDNITDMSSMFLYNDLLTTVDASDWNTSKVTDMNMIFASCSGLTSLDVSKWDTSNVTSMISMFISCSGLTSLNVSKWNTSKVTDMTQMFSNCSSLTSLNVSNWDISNVTDIDRMFGDCFSLTSLNVSSWDTGKVTSMIQLFRGCESLTSLNLSSWKTSSVTDMSRMFEGCSKLYSLNLSSWNTSSVTNMSNMFSNCSSLAKLDLSKWDNTSNVKNTSSMFSDCGSLTELDLSNFDLSKVTISAWRRNMFANCSKLHTLRLDNCSNTTINRIITSDGFPTGDITDAYGKPIKRLIYCLKANAGDLTAPEGWNFRYIEELYKPGQFRGNTTITEVNTIVEKSHSSLDHMFDGCISLTTVDTSDWDTSGVISMSYMFQNCTSLTELDLSSFNTTNHSVAGVFNYMFYGCTALETLDIRNFNLDYYDSEEGYMARETFTNCNSLHTIYMNNCGAYTIEELKSSLSRVSYNGSKTRTIYCKSTNLIHPEGYRVQPPSGWNFVYVD